MIRLLLLTLTLSAARPRPESRTVWDEEEDARAAALEAAGLAGEGVEPTADAEPDDPDEPDTQ